MKKFITIIIAKTIILVGKIFNRGSVLPGSLALKYNKEVKKYFKMPPLVIAVTGSSGKGSTTKLIASTLNNLGYKTTYNHDSNLTSGILTTLFKDCNLKGELRSQALILEVDERFTKEVFEITKPNYLIITNITRDQPPRQGDPEIVYNIIKKAINNNIHLILNIDDPIIHRFGINHPNVTYYGMRKNKYITKYPLFFNLDLPYCPICHKKLIYELYFFEQTGHYYCEGCDFKRTIPDYEITKLDLENRKMLIEDKYELKMDFDLLYNAYNILGAFTLCNTIIKDKNKVTLAMNDRVINNYCYKQLRQRNRDVYITNNKNENATTFNQSILFVNRHKEDKIIVIGWKEISRRYNHDDLSWLYDINFELFKDCKVKEFVCVGPHAFDIATRLKYAFLDEPQIHTFNSCEEATRFLKTKTKDNIYAILNFDLVLPFEKEMRDNHD